MKLQNFLLYYKDNLITLPIIQILYYYDCCNNNHYNPTSTSTINATINESVNTFSLIKTILCCHIFHTPSTLHDELFPNNNHNNNTYNSYNSNSNNNNSKNDTIISKIGFIKLYSDIFMNINYYCNNSYENDIMIDEVSYY